MKYKLFEIEWRGHYPLVEDSMLTVTEPTVGSRIQDSGEQYRIFGYTDEPEWIENTKRIQKGIGLYGWEKIMNIPCDITGNRKFALGRLEQ